MIKRYLGASMASHSACKGNKWKWRGHIPPGDSVDNVDHSGERKEQAVKPPHITNTYLFFEIKSNEYKWAMGGGEVSNVAMKIWNFGWLAVVTCQRAVMA